MEQIVSQSHTPNGTKHVSVTKVAKKLTKVTD